MEVIGNMVKISDLDEYLHADAVENGDVIEITGKARQISQEESAFERTYLEIPVKLSNGRNKVWTPNKTSLKALAKTLGDDADFWVGKKVKLTVARQNVRGKMMNVLYGEPFAETIPKQAPETIQ